MDAVLSSNIESAILTGLESDFVTSMAYKLTENYPNLSKQRIIVPPNVPLASGAPWSNTVIFSLPRVGWLSNMYVNTQFTMSALTQIPAYTNDYNCGFVKNRSSFPRLAKRQPGLRVAIHSRSITGRC